MKYKLLLLWMLIAAMPATAQHADSLLLRQQANHFLQKGKRQHTAGWVLLPAGVVGLIATASADVADEVYGEVVVPLFTGGRESYDSRSYTGYYLLSLGMIGTAIGFFASGDENKKKARRAGVSFKMETAPIQYKGLHGQQHFPAVGVKVPL
ncbi:hypothetical protein [Pseudocnuella soli]|uniref:hypothetical protein n=1 Tax=Pseudocnuella soli TaxID=2502779 RepID=UPI00104DCE46|nr:hypothetical protein [Pseudocnuella soli]